jgi:hypothetical protein
VADKFDPYREALVVEIATVFPDTGCELAAGSRAVLEQRLHADPAACSHLEYIRLHTGFCRKITVTPEDLTRLSS